MSAIKEEVRRLYPVNQVSKGFYYWCDKLLEKCIMIFKWENLPNELPQHELEIQLLLHGYCGVMNIKEWGLFASNGGLTGVTPYADMFETFVWANPILRGGNEKIYNNGVSDATCVLVKNNALKNPLIDLIARYARQLADLDSSINIYTVNTRSITTDTAPDNRVAESVKLVRNKQKLGYYDVIVDKGIIQNVNAIKGIDGASRHMEELLLARETTLRSFFREIGVKMANNKRERVITDEVESENQLLLLNLSDMLKSRKQGALEINELFGTSISVEISDEFKPLESKVASMQLGESEVVNDNKRD